MPLEMNKYIQETYTVSFPPVPSLYLVQDWSHLLLYDASVPPSAPPRRENCQEINPTPIFNTPHPSRLLRFPSRLAPPLGCKVSVLHPTEAEAQHQALSGPAQMPTGTLFICITRLQFQYWLHPPSPPPQPWKHL